MSLASGKEFIAEDPVHVVVASEQQAIYDTSGRLIQPKRRKLFAKFQRGVASPAAIELALNTFSFNKIHQGIARERWFGYYNSREAQLQNNWSDDEHDLIVGRLVEQGYLEVVPVKALPPWPAYDKLVKQGQRSNEHVAQKIAEKVLEDGYDPALVAAYERQNLNRPEVLAVLEVVKDEEPEPLLAA